MIESSKTSYNLGQRKGAQPQFRTASPVVGTKVTLFSSKLSSKRDCGSKIVSSYHWKLGLQNWKHWSTCTKSLRNRHDRCRDIQENYKKNTNFGRYFCTKNPGVAAPKIVVPDRGDTLCRVLKTHWDDRLKLHCPIRHPSRDMTKKTVPVHKHVVMRASGTTAMPRPILLISIWLFILLPRVWTA